MGAEPHDIRTEHWCAGLKLEDSRPFTAVERTILERCIALHARDLLIAFAGIPAAIAAALALLSTPAGEPALWTTLARGAGFLLAAIVAPAVLALVIRDRWRERARFRADLEHGELLRFAGQLHDDEVIDEDQTRLFAAGVLRNEPGISQQIEVLPVSNSVMIRQGRHVRFESVTLSEVAALPEYSLRVAVPREVAWLEGAPDAEIVRRTLNESERGELAAHIRHLRWPSHWVLIGALGLVALGGIMLLDPSTAGDYARRRWPLIALQAAALGCALFEYLRALRLAAQLARDAETGWAFMVALRDSDEESVSTAVTPLPAKPTADAASPADSQLPRRPIEFLPHSRAVWNHQGKPARWRNLRRAA